ncbi:MAG: hypothetical protein RL391_406, partial [Actinomycetota bacterium]
MTNARDYDTVSLITDLGTGTDELGVLHALLRDLAPSARVIDIANDIAPFDVRAASLALARTVPYLPEGIVIACVDPGAGTERRLIAVEVGEGAGVFLGPDNGLLATGVALAGGAGRSFVLDRDEHHLAAPGRTFAARDVLVPVAAALVQGADLANLGTPIDPGSLLPSVLPIARVEDGVLNCEVIWIDRFGNCQINASVDDLEQLDGVSTPVERVRVSIGTDVRNLRVVESFGELGQAALGLVIDASGLLSLAIDRASAA